MCPAHLEHPLSWGDAVRRTLRHPLVIMEAMITSDHDDILAEQLTLLPNPSTPARFRLSRDTRERGLRHVAEIRRMLADRADAQQGRAA